LSDDRLKIAVFIDFDNIEIGVKTTLGTYFDVGAVLEAIKERGEIVTKVAYGDWTRAGDYGRAMSQHAIHMVQRNLTPGGDKNGADINLALDALEMAFTHSHINTFVIVSGDSDFISLVEKLKQYDRKVFVVGGRAFTSVVMQKNCTEFIAYENIIGRRAPDRARTGGEASLAQAMPLVRRALKLLADREVLPQLGLLKSTLLQLDSTFSEREYGASSFRDFVQKLAKAGYVTLKGNERSFHVELREGRETHEAVAAPAPAPAAPVPAAAEAAVPQIPAASSGDGDAGEALRQLQLDGYRVIQDAFARASVPRFPLYLRQVKQIIRTADRTFDERRYAFAGLLDALKFCQREGLVRVDRDRQGVVRIWPGPTYPRPAGGASEALDEQAASSATPARLDGETVEMPLAVPGAEAAGTEPFPIEEQSAPEPAPVRGGAVASDDTTEVAGAASQEEAAAPVPEPAAASAGARRRTRAGRQAARTGQVGQASSSRGTKGARKAAATAPAPAGTARKRSAPKARTSRKAADPVEPGA
jgi:uncharacterized LabA/DUF88 family protein